MASSDTHLAFENQSPSKSVKDYSHHNRESRSQSSTPRSNRKSYEDDEYFANNNNFDREREIILQKMGLLLRNEVIE